MDRRVVIMDRRETSMNRMVSLMVSKIVHLGRKLHNFRWNALTVDWWLCRLPERESISVGDSSVQTARMFVLI